MKKIIEEVKNKYIAQGHNDLEAEKMIEDLKQAGIKELYLTMLEKLQDGDLEEIEMHDKEEEAVEAVRKIFEERTGKKTEKYFEEFFPAFAETFWQNYKIDN